MNPNTKFSVVFITSLILSFALGGTLGYFVPHPRADFKSFGGPGGKGGERMKKMMLDKMSTELNLSENQKKQVQEIFESHAPKMKVLHEEMRPKFDAIRNETQEQIKKVLTPEQAVKFEALNKRMEDKMNRWRDKKRFPG